MIFQTRLKELRTELGLSQMQLSEKTGISQSAIAKWECGKTQPVADAIILLSNFFSVTTDYLLGLTDI